MVDTIATAAYTVIRTGEQWKTDEPVNASSELALRSSNETVLGRRRLRVAGRARSNVFSNGFADEQWIAVEHGHRGSGKRTENR
jgi:hypothetical protein